MRRQTISPTDARFITDDGTTHFERYGYSAAVRAGDTLYISGQIGLDARGGVPSSPAEQIVNAFDRLNVILEAAGSSFNQVVEIVSYHVNIEAHFTDFLSIKQRYVRAPFPTWSAIEVAGLARRGLIVEIKATAYCPQ